MFMIFSLLQKVLTRRQHSIVIDPAIPDYYHDFIRENAETLTQLGINFDREGVYVEDELQINESGFSTRIVARINKSFEAAGISGVLQEPKSAVQTWLQQLGHDLHQQAKGLLAKAHAEISQLAELVLASERVDFFGGEVEARKQYFDIPSEVLAARAIAVARSYYKEALEKLTTHRLAEIAKRIKANKQISLKGKNLRRSYLEVLKIFDAPLELEVSVDKSLDHLEIEKLFLASQVELDATLDDIFAPHRKALLARIHDHLKDLGKKVTKLPHIELLSHADIAETIAPYYGGLDRSLKKKRAKSALVAVEERAREAKYQGDVAKFNEKRSEFADVSRYYPLARSLHRELILYVGPTNSGKTWRALNELAAGESGVYLAPLRLLALEGQEELEKRGKLTSFITGEERDLRPGAQFVSSTIEMLNTDHAVDVVVVDEVQLLADERRGWAWLAAVVGAPAKKIVMTGSPDCVEMVKDLAQFLGEPLTINTCERHNELKVAQTPMQLSDVRPGMAVVCFSRRDVMRIKQQIEANSKFKVAVIYGNLSPQVRREEARRFRSGEAEILVATDAIAMGLNLPIKEVLFYTVEKFNGEEIVKLSASDVRQIGGRAGRYGVAQFGVVNALDQFSLKYIRSAISGRSEMLAPRYYVAPGRNHISIISEVLNTTSLERILTFFERAIEFSDDRFLRANIDDLSYLSTFVDQRLAEVDVMERLTVACAPVPIRNERVLYWFLNRMLPLLASAKKNEEQDFGHHLVNIEPFKTGVAKNQLELQDAEDHLKILTIYAWLAYRYPEVFHQIELCEEQREVINGFIERSLRKISHQPRPAATGRKKEFHEFSSKKKATETQVLI